MTVAGVEWEVQPEKVLQERVNANLVYSCTCSSPGHATFEGVLKYAETFSQEVRSPLLAGRHTSVLAFTNAHGSAFLLFTCSHYSCPQALIMQLLWQGYREPLATAPLLIPKLWYCEEGAKPYIITHPYGTAITFETPAEQLLTVVVDVAGTLSTMASMGVSIELF